MYRRHEFAHVAWEQSLVEITLPETAGGVKDFVDELAAQGLVFLEGRGERCVQVAGEDLCEDEGVFDGVCGGFVAGRHLYSMINICFKR